jgi:hypothetical protein
MRLASVISVVAVVALLAGCGGDDGQNGDSASTAPAMTGKTADFPKPDGQDLRELARGLGPGPVLSPATPILQEGENRFGFGLFDRARKQIAQVPAALYLAPANGGRVRGPFVVKAETLAVEPEFQSISTKSDPDSARGVYVTDLEFPRSGDYEVLAVVRLDDRLAAAGPVGVKVAEDDSVPDRGEQAVRVSVPTKSDVGGNLKEIDTREPPSSMHDEDLKDVVGKKPTVLLFATAALCQSRVCGPVIDVTEQVKAKHDDVAFVHSEIYVDNELEKGPRPQVSAWKLQSEPWAFVIDRRGRISERFQGAFSARELDAAIARAKRT